MTQPLHAPREPSPDHPITITRSASRVVVQAGGRVIADTREALALKESTYAVVHYIPRKDVDMSALTRTSHSTFCPYKGEASYFSINVPGGGAENAVWTYESPYPAVSAIASHLAFYPDRVESIDTSELL
ncbi:DUF427 domain-containing protein [Pandoraea commovens]|uniref:DUF427 domain-containing protein n=1 Tax=Pandoraea commovens TaxID=2508289 RepID=A0A5E4SVG2_9BURK|nr:DUF427 domain-containing protein [Pandoraea commovens]VVD77799.1 hypothetical protein PCO31010_00976 [Pandoraea commovens]